MRREKIYCTYLVLCVYTALREFLSPVILSFPKDLQRSVMMRGTGPIGLCPTHLQFSFGSRSLDRHEKERKGSDFLATRLSSESSPHAVVCQGDGSGILVARSGGEWLHPIQIKSRQLIVDINSTTYVGETEDKRNIFVTGPENVMPHFVDGGFWVSPRSFFASLTPSDLGILGAATSLHQWRAAERFCCHCGQPNKSGDYGMSVQCASCGRSNYPRVSPAMIVAVLNGAGDVLLGQRVAQTFAAGAKPMLTVLAGFVAPGESAEEAVEREVFEESGLSISKLRYVGSQPWPFPSQLMVCYYAVADSPTDLRADELELSSIGWVSKQQVRQALRGENDSFLIPPSFTAAHTLLQSWANGDVSDSGDCTRFPQPQ